MQRPPFMFAAIVLVIFAILLGVIAIWFNVLPWAQAGGYPAAQ